MFRPETPACCLGPVSSPDDVSVSVAEPSYHLYIIAVPPAGSPSTDTGCVRSQNGASASPFEGITSLANLMTERVSAIRSPGSGVRFVASVTMPQTAETLRALRAGHPDFTASPD